MSFIYLISDLTEFNVIERKEGIVLFDRNKHKQIHGTKFCRETRTGGQPVRFSREQDCFAASNDLQHCTTPTSILNITVSFSGKYSLNLTWFPPWKRHDFHHKETSGKRSLWLIKSPTSIVDWVQIRN